MTVKKLTEHKEIAGWQPITPSEVKDCPKAQIVNGQWYIPIFGCDSLLSIMTVCAKM